MTYRGYRLRDVIECVSIISDLVYTVRRSLQSYLTCVVSSTLDLMHKHIEIAASRKATVCKRWC